MQKKLIALAIAGLASTTAFAQSNVTVYGVMDASVDFTDSGDTAVLTSQRVTKVSSNQSRIGFKGSEDLGNGLKAIFQIETAINADGGATASLNSRNTFVGLEGKNWGMVRVGQYDTPYKTARIDYFGDHLGDHRNLMGAGKTSFDGRPANTIRYDSPDMSGFDFALSYTAAAETAATTAVEEGEYWSASAKYKISSAWDIRASYERHEFGSAGSGTLAAAGGVVAGEAEKAWKIGTSYKSGPLRASFEYESIDDDFSVATTVERKAWTLGGGYTVGSNEFLIAYTVADDLDGISDTGGKQWAIGMDHTLSKRTKLYAYYVDLTNDAAATFGLTGAGGNTTGGTAALGAGADPSGFQFGVMHKF